VHALDYALVLQKFRRDIGEVSQLAAELAAFATEQRLRVFRAKGAFFRGWARALAGEVTEGLSEMHEGIASERAADTPHDFALYFEMLAEVYGLAGRVNEGLRAIGDAFAIAERHGIVYWNAELHRRRGELLLAAGERDAAEACFREAAGSARAQGARSLELRAAVSLSRLHGEGRSSPAATLLRPLYNSFEEGFDTPDLAEARQLLEVPG
jgi:adenylate cyclase